MTEMTKKDIAKLILKSTLNTTVDINYQGYVRFFIKTIKHTSFFTWTLESNDGISKPKDNDGRAICLSTYNKAKENLASYLDVEQEYEEAKSDVKYFCFSDDDMKNTKSGKPVMLRNLKDGNTFTIDNQGDNVTRAFVRHHDKAVCVFAKGMRKDYALTLPLDFTVFWLEKKS